MAETKVAVALLVIFTFPTAYTDTVYAVVGQKRVILPCSTGISQGVDWNFISSQSGEYRRLYANSQQVSGIRRHYELQQQSIGGEHNLAIPNPTTYDAGTYICAEDAGLGTKHEFALELKDELVFPKSDSSTVVVKVIGVGQSATLSCPTKQNGVVWKYQKTNEAEINYVVVNGIVKPIFRQRVKFFEGSLIFPLVQSDDAGIYLCVEDDGHGSSHAVQLITVSGSLDKKQTVSPGSMAVFGCAINDTATPHWVRSALKHGDISIFNGKDVKPDLRDRVSVYVSAASQTSYLVIRNVQPDDSAEYKCIGIHADERSYELDVVIPATDRIIRLNSDGNSNQQLTAIIVIVLLLALLVLSLAALVIFCLLSRKTNSGGDDGNRRMGCLKASVSVKHKKGRNNQTPSPVNAGCTQELLVNEQPRAGQQDSRTTSAISVGRMYSSRKRHRKLFHEYMALPSSPRRVVSLARTTCQRSTDGMTSTIGRWWSSLVSSYMRRPVRCRRASAPLLSPFSIAHNPGHALDAIIPLVSCSTIDEVEALIDPRRSETLSSNVESAFTMDSENANAENSLLELPATRSSGTSDFGNKNEPESPVAASVPTPMDGQVDTSSSSNLADNVVRHIPESTPDEAISILSGFGIGRRKPVSADGVSGKTNGVERCKSVSDEAGKSSRHKQDRQQPEQDTRNAPRVAYKRALSNIKYGENRNAKTIFDAVREKEAAIKGDEYVLGEMLFLNRMFVRKSSKFTQERCPGLSFVYDGTPSFPNQLVTSLVDSMANAMRFYQSCELQFADNTEVNPEFNNMNSWMTPCDYSEPAKLTKQSEPSTSSSKSRESYIHKVDDIEGKIISTDMEQESIELRDIVDQYAMLGKNYYMTVDSISNFHTDLMF